MKKIDENNFIRELRLSNEQALYFVIDNYAWLLKTIIAKNLSILPNLKEECLNDCLMAIWENIEYYDEKKSQFKNWIGGIAKYKCIDYKRKYEKELVNINLDDLILADEQSIEEKIISKEIEKEIYAMLSCLAAQDRDIFIKFYFEDAKVSEISQKLNLSEDTIYKRLSRGRNKLRKEIKVIKRCSNE